MSRPGGSVLRPAGPQADHIGDLWDVFFAVCVVVTALVLVFTLVAAVRATRRRREEHVDDPMASDPASDRRLHAVIGAALAATVITLVVLLVASIRTGRALASSADEPPALTVIVTAHQWWWQLEYLDPEPSRHVITANEIHVPAGQTVELRLRSADVIHSFWVPSLHGKIDLIPGRENQLPIRIDRPGTYRGQCAEFCGAQHARMEILVVADPPDEFARWRDRQLEPARAPITPSQLRGRALFLTTSCAMCHTVSGTSAGGGLGPDLTHVASRSTLGAGTLPNTRATLARWLLDPQAHKPGVRMPSQAFAGDDLEALLDYLELLQ
jgi:cytochrome c oxidase subunit 2